MAENDIQLQRLLNVANSFVTKWDMKFNGVMFKVMIVGKRIENVLINTK